MNKDRSIGAAILILCVTVAIVYIAALFWPAMEPVRLWVVAIPVAIAFIGVLAIGAWIGWTMVSTPAPKPIENADMEATTEPGKAKVPEK